MTQFRLNGRSEIVGGPSKFDLMLALFDRPPERSIEFTVASKDNPGQTFTIGVNIVRVGRVFGGWEWIGRPSQYDPANWRWLYGEFRTDTRKGWIEEGSQLPLGTLVKK